ncbi:MAG: AAA family ATPase, partial [Gammaproteobacteria bacterium]
LGAKMVHNEIHHGEAVEEKISLSDRFGLWVSFYVFKQDLYLEIVQKTIARLCVESSIEPQWDEGLAKTAIKWSHEKSKRCGRTALQFARHWLGQHMLEKDG